MLEVYELSKGSYSFDNSNNESVPSFLSNMIKNLPKGSFIKIVSIFVGKSTEEVIKRDSLELASIFMGGMIINKFLYFHSFMEDLKNVR